MHIGDLEFSPEQSNTVNSYSADSVEEFGTLVALETKENHKSDNKTAMNITAHVF
jgi:hypothetical protein